MSGDNLIQQELSLFSDPDAPEGDPKHPGHFIAIELQKRNLTQVDLARILGRPIPTVNEIIHGKRAIMPEMAVALGKAFNLEPGIWAHREAAYRVFHASREEGTGDTEQRSFLYQLAPIKDMERRSWIQETTDVSTLRSELETFFGTNNLEQFEPLPAVARKSLSFESFSPAQIAWLRQGQRLAEIMPSGRYCESNLKDGLAAVRKLAKSASSTASVSNLLAEIGIRFVIIEQLPKSRIDGATFWLDENSPVILLSVRFDRIDSFWHTLAHELRHVLHRDEISLDIDLVGDKRSAHSLLDKMEKRADQEGANWLIDQDKLDSFIRRHSPYISLDKIVMFARRMEIAPGIVVGQLHHKGIPYSRHRKALEKIRSFIIGSSMTDGFGAPPTEFKQILT